MQFEWAMCSRQMPREPRLQRYASPFGKDTLIEDSVKAKATATFLLFKNNSNGTLSGMVEEIVAVPLTKLADVHEYVAFT